MDFITRVENNNFRSNDPNIDRIHVERVEENPYDPCGVMIMRNLCRLDPQDPDRSECKLFDARAKALFAKSTEDEILIQFEYLWDPEGNGTLLEPGKA